MSASTLDPKALAEQSRQYARAHLKQASAELLQWRDSGVLPDGHVRELARQCAEWAGSTNALSVAERLVEVEALRLAADSAGIAPGTEGTTDVQAVRAAAFREAAAWFSRNDPEAERFFPAFKLHEMASGLIEPPLTAVSA